MAEGGRAIRVAPAAVRIRGGAGGLSIMSVGGNLLSLLAAAALASEAYAVFTQLRDAHQQPRVEATVGDELYFTAPEGREFAARCRKPDPAAKTPNTCLAEMRTGDVDVEIRFAAALLSEWRALCDGARSLIAAARRRSKPLSVILPRDRRPESPFAA
jgi:hypothetical protein